jgi:hypothetical protein
VDEPVAEILPAQLGRHACDKGVAEIERHHLRRLHELA